MGRQPWEPGPDRSDENGKRITVRLTKEEHAKALELASQLKVKDPGYWSYERTARVSDVVRMALEEFVATRLTPPLKPEKKPAKKATPRKRAAGAGVSK